MNFKKIKDEFTWLEQSHQKSLEENCNNTAPINQKPKMNFLTILLGSYEDGITFLQNNTIRRESLTMLNEINGFMMHRLGRRKY